MRPQSQIHRPGRLLVYVIARDNGLAPNITGSTYCTLAVCKPVVRRHARVGQDWIVGMSTNKHGPDKLIYAMQVEDKIGYQVYFDNPRFAHKKPTAQQPCGDNFFAVQNGELTIQSPYAAHHGRQDAIKRDLNSPLALISRTYWYFGANAPHVSQNLQQTRLVQGNRRGHRVIQDPATINTFYTWLTENYRTGIHGPPRDSS